MNKLDKGNYINKYSILSLFSFSLFLFLSLWYAYPGLKIAFGNKNKIFEADAIKSLYRFSFSYLPTFFLFFHFIIFNSIFISFLIRERDVSFNKIFFSIFFMGMFFWIFHFFSRIKIKVSINNFSNFVALSTTSALAFIFPFLMNETQEDAIGENILINYSLDPKKPNVLFFFEDGISSRRIEKFGLSGIEKNVMKNFVSFPNSISAGIQTNFGESPFMDGTSLPFLNRLQKDETSWLRGYSGFVEKVKLFQTYSKIRNNQTKAQINNYYINPQLIGKTLAGSVKLTQKIFYDNNDKKKLNVVNWTRAREAANENGDHFQGHYNSLEKYVAYAGRHLNNNKSVIFSYGSGLHYPYIVDAHGRVTPFGISTEKNVYISMFGNYNFIFNKLKHISNNITNAFDNSIIIIIGDHGSHEATNPTLSSPGERFITQTYIKLPNFHGELIKLNNRELWTPHLKHIYEDFYLRSPNIDKKTFVDWVSRNNNFDKKQRFVTFGYQTFNNNDVSASFVYNNNNKYIYKPINSIKNNIFSINKLTKNQLLEIKKETAWN